MIEAKDILAEDATAPESTEEIIITLLRRDGRRYLVVNGREHDITDIPPMKVHEPTREEKQRLIEKLKELKREHE